MVTRSSGIEASDATQGKLFPLAEQSSAIEERLVLRALGDFQQRGKVLVERSLPLDRLRGALRRQAAELNLPELPDERYAEILLRLGARVQRVPVFVAKHPFRITVPVNLAERALQVLTETDSRSSDSKL